MVHEGFELYFDGNRHRVPFTELTGWTTCMYGQQEVVKDLIKAREAAGGQIHFGIEDVSPREVDTDAPRVCCTAQGEPVEIVNYRLRVVVAVPKFEPRPLAARGQRAPDHQRQSATFRGSQIPH